MYQVLSKCTNQCNNIYAKYQQIIVKFLLKLLNECFYDGMNEITNITYIYKGHDFFICSHNSKIIGLGHYVPNNIVTNDDLSKVMDTSYQWIQERTGIK